MSKKPTRFRESYFESLQEAGAARTVSQAMSMDASNRDRSIPRRPLLWLAAALLFTLPPMFGSLVSWVPWVFLLALAMKFWMEPRGYRLRFATLKVLLATAALFAIFASYGSLKGVEPGISLLVVLVALKVLEAHTGREFQVMVLMGWVLCLCGFFLSQEFKIALSLLTAFALLLVALIQFHRGSSPGALWPPLGTTGKILLQAAPLVVLLFILFPRINTGLRFDIRAGGSANTGFSRATLPGQYRSACKFVGHCFSRGVSRAHHDATWSHVLARRSHVALRRSGMARPVRAGIDHSFSRAIAEGKYDSPTDYARPAWRALDVCTRSAF